MKILMLVIALLLASCQKNEEVVAVDGLGQPFTPGDSPYTDLQYEESDQIDRC